MYYIAVKDAQGKYYIEQKVADWHKYVASAEPIDCLNGEMVIYDEPGQKYFVGPPKNLKEKKLLFGLKLAEVGTWNREDGEPYLIKTDSSHIPELDELINKGA